jgi:hypothetical protein
MATRPNEIVSEAIDRAGVAMMFRPFDVIE